MVDSKLPHQDSGETDAAISRLYRTSRDQDTPAIPEELDAAILAHARQAVAPEEASSTVPCAREKGAVPLRRRWEIPTSVAATVAFASLLYLYNQDSVTPQLDTGTPQFDYAEPISAPNAMAPTASVPEMSREQQAIPASPAPAAKRAATAEADSADAEPPPLRKKSIPAATDRSEPALGLEQKQLAAPLGAVRRDRMLDAPAVQSAPARAEAHERRLPDKSTTLGSSTETEAQPIAKDAWLEHITALWQQGNRAQAQAELAEFRAHFPGYALDSLCTENPGLCRTE